jgi:hypothetical protein|tara:strand:- start:45 stop:368 length:324 start_codon:yes stop_codon:yes gene_type:complete
MNTKPKSALQNHVDSIAHDLSNGMTNEEGEPVHGFDYLEDVLDIQYIVTSERQYLAARVLVAFGGPNIWINTQTKTVEGYWWDESAFASYYEDEIGIDEALEELWNC